MNSSEEALEALYTEIYEAAQRLPTIELINRLMRRRDLLSRMEELEAPPLITERQEVMIAATTRVVVERGLL